MKQKHDQWFFTGAKAMSGTFDGADAADSDSVNKPFTTDLTDTAHGLLAGSLLYIQGSTNYNGLREIKSIPDVNSMIIYAKFVAETLAGTETWKTMFTYDKFVQGELRPGSPFEFLGFYLTLDAAAGTASEEFTITIDAAKGSAWDNRIYTKDMNGQQHINYIFDDPKPCAAGDKLDCVFANADTNTWGLTLFTRPLVQKMVMAEIINGIPQNSLAAIMEKILIIETPEGKYRVKNFYVDPETGKLIVEYEDIPEED